jgi:hypothetical protein
MPHTPTEHNNKGLNMFIPPEKSGVDVVVDWLTSLLR